MENYQTLSKTTMGVGKNSTSLKRVRQQVFISSCWAETVYPQTSIYVSWLPSAYISNFKRSPRPFKLPPPHSSNCLGDSLRLEIKRTLFATVVMVRFGVWNTNKSANQPLRWDVGTNSEKRGWTFCPASSNTYPKSILLHNVKQPLKNNFKNVFEWLFLYNKRKIKTYSPLNRDNFLLFRCLFSKDDTWLCWERNR